MVSTLDVCDVVFARDIRKPSMNSGFDGMFESEIDSNSMFLNKISMAKMLAKVYQRCVHERTQTKTKSTVSKFVTLT